MKEKFKLFASDIDKTLIFTNDTIPQELKEMVLEFQEKSNYKLTLVTGRNYFLTKPIANELGVKLPVIISNGSAIIDPNTDEIIYLNSISIEKCIRIIKQFENDRSADITLYTEFEMFSLERSRWNKYLSKGSEKYKEEYLPKNNIFKSIQEMIDCISKNKPQITRVLLDFETIDDAEKGDKNLDKKNLYSILYINKYESVIEVFNENTNKAIGIDEFIKKYNIQKNQVAIFGDQINDIEMFEKYFYSFAVENSIEVLKELAYKVIGSVYEFGVGKQLLELLDYIED